MPIRAGADIFLLVVLLLVARSSAAEPGLGSWDVLREEELSVHHKAVAHWGLGQLETAERELKALSDARPGAAGVAANLALLRLEQRRASEAEAAVATALAAAPGSARVRYLQGRQLAATGRSGDAERAFAQGAALDPGEPIFHLRLAELYAAAGRTADAEKALRAVLRLRPEHGPALNRLGRLVEGAGGKKEAAELLRRFASLDPRRAARAARCVYEEPAEPDPSAKPPHEGRWLDIKAVGEEKGPVVATVQAGRLVLRKTVPSGTGRFWLGSKERVDAVRVDWIDGKHSYRVDAGAGETLVIEEITAHVW